MDFRFTDEHDQLRAAMRGSLERGFGALTASKTVDAAKANTDSLWKMAAGQGWLALMVPIEADGLGLGAVESVLLHEELGRIGPSAPFATNIGLLAGLRRAGVLAAEIDALLPAVAMGEAVVGLAENGPGGTGWLVEYPALVSHVLFLDVTEGKAALVERAALGAADTREAFDLTRPLAFIAAPAAWSSATLSRAAWADALGAARIGLAAEQIGLAEKALERTIAYTKDRVQFGKPIGSFQALKHKLADAFVAIENAKTATYYAAWAWDNATADAATSVDIARAYAGEMAWRVGTECIQAHGGMGFTWEAGLHLSVRRARRLANTLGTAAEARAAIAEALLG